MPKILQDVADIHYGKSQSGVADQYGHFPIIGTGGFLGNARVQLFNGPAVVVGRKGTLDNPLYVPGDFWAVDTTYAVIPKENIHAKWLYFSLCNSRLGLLNEATGVPSINRDRLYRVPVQDIEYPVQSRIAYVLDTIDEAIAKAEAVIAKLKQVRAGMLHDLLSFGLDENGQLRDPIAHPEQFKDSPLGRMPREWEVSRIEDVSEKVQDGTHFSPKSNKGPRRYLTSKNIRLGYIDLSDCGWISENEHHAIFRRCDVRRGDVLLTKDGANTGNAAINILDDDFSLLSSVAFIRGKKGRLISEYLLNYLISPVAQKKIKDLMSGNAITRLTLQKIKDFTIPVPEPIEQQMIAAYFNECAKTISAYEAELESYKNIKFGLQDDLLTGRVRVPETIISIDNGKTPEATIKKFLTVQKYENRGT